MDLYRQRRDRTVLVSCNEGEILCRQDIIRITGELFGSDKTKIISIGELHPRRWEIVLTDDYVVSNVMRKARVVLGERVFSFQQLRRQPRRLRVKRIPMCIPHDHIVALLETYGIKVRDIKYERDPEDGITTNTRLVLVDVDTIR